MKNLIFIPFAFDQSKQTGVNVNKKNTLEIYLKNICVAAVSTKRFNMDCDVAIMCNIDLPDYYKSILLENNILIFVEDFDLYNFPNDYKWNLAFYKLCALEKAVQKFNYDNYIYMDADVIAQESFNGIFNELTDNILLYDINHGFNVLDYCKIVKEFQEFGVNSHITHYGGEFFAASYENAKKFVLICKEIYKKMIETNFVTEKGDEFIISIAAFYCKEIIKNAGAYIFRFWTQSFYLVSTCYKYNPIFILHLPNEKNRAIIKIFDRYIARKKFPTKTKIHRLCHLKNPSIKTTIKGFVKQILGK